MNKPFVINISNFVYIEKHYFSFVETKQTDLIQANIYSNHLLLLVFCADPTPENGYINGSQSYLMYPVDTTVTLLCNSGYTLDGPTSSTCQASGIWFPYPPTCHISNATILFKHVIRIQMIVTHFSQNTHFLQCKHCIMLKHMATFKNKL